MQNVDIAAVTALVGTVVFLRLSLPREMPSKYNSVIVTASLALMIFGFYYMLRPLSQTSEETFQIDLHREVSADAEDLLDNSEEFTMEEGVQLVDETRKALLQEPPVYTEATVGKQYHGGYGSTVQRQPASTNENYGGGSASSSQVRGAPVTAAPSYAMKHKPVGFGGDGVPSTACGIKRGGRPFYMFGVGM